LFIVLPPVDVSDDLISENSDVQANHDWFFDAIDSVSDDLMNQGYMVHCDPLWYCVHWYTDQGSWIQQMQIGDIAHVEGMSIIIDGQFDIARTAYVEDVRAEVGSDVVIFQTCYGPGGDYMLGKYGHVVS
jgi:hypothetical protein